MSAWARARRTLGLVARRPAGAFGLLVIGLVVVVALLDDLLVPGGPNQVDIPDRLAAPSAEHWMGTDQLGRDVLDRVVLGASVSLQVGFVAVGISLVAGVLVGADSMSRVVGVPTYLADVIVATALLSVLVAALFASHRVRLR